MLGLHLSGPDSTPVPAQMQVSKRFLALLEQQLAVEQQHAQGLVDLVGHRRGLKAATQLLLEQGQGLGIAVALALHQLAQALFPLAQLAGEGVEAGHQLADGGLQAGHLLAGIAAVKPGNRVGDISAAIQEALSPGGYGIVRDFVGHGVGRKMHEEPQIPNYGKAGTGPKLLPGMALAIEPMVNLGSHKIVMASDGWTARTADGKVSAHFEHTVLVTDGEPEILTWRPREALPEMLGLPAW